jgi:hypothetical protein
VKTVKVLMFLDIPDNYDLVDIQDDLEGQIVGKIKIDSVTMLDDYPKEEEEDIWTPNESSVDYDEDEDALADETYPEDEDE